MRRPTKLITESGVWTSLRWWGTVRVEGNSVVLVADPESDGRPTFVLAELGSESQAQELFSAISRAVSYNAPFLDLHRFASGTLRGGPVLGTAIDVPTNG